MKIRDYFKKYFDGELTLILVVFYLITICLNLIKVFSTAYLRGTEVAQQADYLVELYLLDAVVVLGIMQLIAMHTKRLILNRTSWRKILIFHFVLALFLGVVIQFITDLYRLQMGIIDNFHFNRSLLLLLSVVDVNFLVYFAMLFIIYTYYYFSIIRAGEKRESLLETQVVTAKMSMLTSQLQPHFLFNTINCIIGLIDIDKKKAQDTLVDLSEMFREITKNQNVHFFTVAKEMELLGHYLEIVKVRFPENLEIVSRVAEETLPLYLPAMIIQPLIENSINHGFENTANALRIEISIQRQGEFLRVSVSNNGPLLGESSRTSQTGMGISNLRQRLENLYGSKASFIMANNESGVGVTNVILLPIMDGIPETRT